MLRFSSFTLRSAVAGLAILGYQANAQSPVVVPTNNASTLASALVGSGVTIVGTPTYTGGAMQSGTFTGAGANSVGFASGILLTTGLAASAAGVYAGPNLPSTILGLPGDQALSAIVEASTLDAAVLQFSFNSTAPQVYFTYTFASAEYPHFVGSQFNDVFAFFVNGVNYALIPGTTTPVSVDSVNALTNSSFFNGYTQVGGLLPYGGRTKTISFTAPVSTTSVNTIRLAIADTSDGQLDSAVFIEGGSLSVTPPGQITTSCPLPSGTLNTNYGPIQFTQNGFSSAPVWTVSSGALPPGINLSALGVVMGIPTTTGTYMFTVQAATPAPNPVSTTEPCSVTIAAPTPPPPPAPPAPPPTPPAPPPHITTSCPLPAGAVYTNYGPVQFTQTGFSTAPAWTITGGALPTGLTLSSPGVVLGIPTMTGTFLFTVQATGPPIGELSGLVSTEACSVTITGTVVPPLPVPPPLTITTSCPLPPATVGSIYQAGLSAFGGSAPISFSIGGGLPPGLLLDNNVVRGMPSSAGTFNFTLQIGNLTQACSIVVAPNPLVLTGCPLPGGTVGVGYNAGVSVAGGVAPYSFFLGGLPPGLGLGNGVIAGTPSSPGTYNVTVRGTDTTGINITQSCPVVIAAAPPLSVTSISGLPNGTVGVAYSAALSATGGVGSLTYSGSGLPANLSLNPDGTITGTPAAAGTSSISVTVTDSRGVSASAQFTLVVGSAPPVITTSCPLPPARVNVAYSAPLGASAGSPPYRWSLSGGSLPGGVSLDPAGTVLGNPTTAGLSSFTLRVTDQNSATATLACGISVADALTITSVNPTSFTAGGVEPTLKNGQAPLTITGTGFGSDSTVLVNGTPITSTINGPTSISAAVDASLIAQPGTATVTVKSSVDGAVSNGIAVKIILPPFPTLSLLDLPDPIAPAQQPAAGLQIESLSSGPATYPFDITGTVNLTVTPDPSAGTADPLVKFLNDGLSSSFTLKAGTSQVALPPLMSTGTVASTLTFSVGSLSAAGQTFPSLPASKTTHVARLAPVIQSACYTSTTGGFTLSVTGYSTTRSLTQMGVNFTAAAGATLPTSSLTIDLQNVSSTYFASPTSVASGGLFTLSVPLTVQGTTSAVAGFAVSLSNSVGSSGSQTAAQCP